VTNLWVKIKIWATQQDRVKKETRTKKTNKQEKEKNEEKRKESAREKCYKSSSEKQCKVTKLKMKELFFNVQTSVIKLLK